MSVSRINREYSKLPESSNHLDKYLISLKEITESLANTPINQNSIDPNIDYKKLDEELARSLKMMEESLRLQESSMRFKYSQIHFITQNISINSFTYKEQLINFKNDKAAKEESIRDAIEKVTDESINHIEGNFAELDLMQDPAEQDASLAGDIG